MLCRHCANPLRYTFLDLGFAPPSNAYLTVADLSRPEIYYPLRVKVCDKCWLVQTEDYARPDELFSADYAYFSSTSASWLAHAKMYCQQMTDRLELGPHSYVVEVASNDGYLLRNFVEAGIPCLGIEPTASTAAAAQALGIPVLQEFFGKSVARSLSVTNRAADLIVGNNVYAHVPDINGFTIGIAALLKPEGVVTLEFPHLLKLIENMQFDTVYHEHYSYLSLSVVERIFNAAGLRIWDVEELTTHGGSLRVFGCHAASRRKNTGRVNELREKEDATGLRRLGTYTRFQEQADKLKDDLVAFLIEQKRSGRKVAAYGAAAKGNTLINYAGIKSDLIPYVCDAAPAKQSKLLPGSHIPIKSPEQLRWDMPDFVLILPWNIFREVRFELSDLADRGTRFVTASPVLRIH